SKLNIPVRIDRRSNERPRRPLAGIGLTPPACGLAIRIAVPTVVVDLRRNRCRSIVRSRRDAKSTERLPDKSFLQISKADDVTWLKPNPAYAGLELNIRVSLNRPIQIEFQNPRRLVVVRNAQH